MKYLFIFLFFFLNLTDTQNNEGQKISDNKNVELPLKISFYRNQLPFNDLNEFDTSILSKPEVLTFPFALWSKGIFNKKKAKDYGTILLQLELPDTKHQYFYHFERITGGCEVWINNQYNTSFGSFSKNLQQSSSKGTPLDLKLPKQKKITIAMLMSNHQHYSGGGINLKPKLLKEEIFLKQHKNQVIKEFSAVIILLLLISYQCILYFLYKEKKYIYLAIICLAFILRTMVTKHSMIYDFFPKIPFFIIQKLRYASIYLACISVLLFYREFIPKQINKKVFLLLLGSQSLGILGCMMLPTYPLTQLASILKFFVIFQIIYILYFILQATYKKEAYSKLLMISILVVCGCLINNVLYVANKINTFIIIIIYLPLIYLLVQTIINHFIQRDINRQLLLLSAAIADKEKENQDLKLETLSRIQEKEQIKASLKEITSKSAEIKTVLAFIQSTAKEDEKSKLLKSELEKDLTNFTKNLQQAHSNLTKTDIEIAIYIVLGKNRQEIADLRNITIASVKTSRNRLRKKLELTKEILLDDYLKSFE